MLGARGEGEAEQSCPQVGHVGVQGGREGGREGEGGAAHPLVKEGRGEGERGARLEVNNFLLVYYLNFLYII